MSWWIKCMLLCMIFCMHICVYLCNGLCMCVCICYVHVYIILLQYCVYVYHLWMCIYAWVDVWIYMHMVVCVQTYVALCMQGCVYMDIWIYTFMEVCISTCMDVCMHTLIHLTQKIDKCMVGTQHIIYGYMSSLNACITDPYTLHMYLLFRQLFITMAMGCHDLWSYKAVRGWIIQLDKLLADD